MLTHQIASSNRSGARTRTSVTAAAFFFLLVVITSRTTNAAFFNKSGRVHNSVQRPFGTTTKLYYRSEYNVAFEPQPTTDVLQTSTRITTTTPTVEEIPTTDDRMIPQAMSTEEYRAQVSEEHDRLVVVRFHSPFCKACKAIKPRYNRFLSKYPSVKFVDVPVTSDNAEIHESLGIESLPHGVIYHPGQGLVESSKMNTNVIRYFEKMIKSYVQESCPLPDFNEDTQRFDSPYPRGMFIKPRLQRATL